MALFEIKSRYDGRVLFSLECGSLKLCVEAAVKARANLACANLAGANLAGANLAGANLACADLACANLACANLADANFACANLAGANLADAKDIPAVAIAQSRILPEGDLIGWKKCNDNVLVKLRIPAEAKRSHAFSRKCRAEYVDVLEVIGADIGVTNVYGPRTEYRAGQRVKAHAWDDDFRNECAPGVHFFITKEEAEQW